MGKEPRFSDRTLVAVGAVSAVALTIVSVLVMDWFVIHLGQAASGADKATFDLRSIHVCHAGICASVELSQFPVLTRIGFYTNIAPIVFWGSLVFAAIVAYQAATKLLSDHASEGITKLGYGIGVTFMLATAATGFVFKPDVEPLGLVRTFAPHLLLLAYASGLACLYFAHRQAEQIPAARTVVPEKHLTLPIPRERAATAPPMRAQTAPVVPRTRSRPIPEPLKNKLSFSTLTAALSAGGVDAHREDGEARLVLWRDVVGAVARRLPPEQPYDGISFVDLVSSRRSTLRILPWTRLSGEPVEGEGDERCRAFIRLVCSYCPDMKLDRATQKFLDGTDPPAQLPDEATLAAHDERLS